MALVKQLARSVRTAGSVHSAWFHHQGCVRHRPFSSQRDWPAVLREALVPPAAQEDKFRSLSNCKKYKPGSQSLSQILQDRWVDEAFQGQQNLFAVECGAFDGELESNTIWLETEKNWECLLVEANPLLADLCISKRPRSHVLKGGLSMTPDPGIFPFRAAAIWGGFEETLSDTSMSRMERMRDEYKDWLDSPMGNQDVIDVPAFPLHMVMEALGKREIHFFSLDTEGSESKILENTDFHRLEIGVVVVEWLGEETRRKQNSDILTANGFKLVQTSWLDDFWAHPKFFENRKLPFPDFDAPYLRTEVEWSAWNFETWGYKTW